MDKKEIINEFLNRITVQRVQLELLYEEINQEGFIIAATLVADAADYLDDITWRDFTREHIVPPILKKEE